MAHGWNACLQDCQFASSLAGSVEELLDTYDRDRRVLPPPVQVWEWGWTKSAEVLNGRIAMVRLLQEEF